MGNEFLKEREYLKVKKQVKKIKNLYIHIVMSLIIMPIMVIVNLTIIEPQFHWFWFGIGGVFLGVFFNWLGVFGSNLFFGKNWEKNQIKKYMDDNDF